MTELPDILILIVQTIILLTVLVVLLSFTVAWYERANAAPDLIDRRFTARGFGLSLWLMIQEIACLLLTLLLRPCGWHRQRLQPGPVNNERRPVILLHGLFQNRSCLFWLAHRLRCAGWSHVYSINTPPWRDIETLTEILAKKVDEIRLALQVDQVDLVGHSMGGMIARNYVQHRGGAPRVRRLVTLGTPHRGSKLAPFAISKIGLSLLPGSAFLTSFNAGAWPAETDVVSLYSRHDNIVLPTANATLSGIPAIELSGMGHNALLFHPRTLQAVVDALARPKPHA
ncbi:MAG: alpha/beta fold hydrolase [Desulfuromonadales bacterium]|nr:alpha/beta fold hydrolase [Desulfuromonadales bacterium]